MSEHHTDPAGEHRPPHMTPEEFRTLGHRMVDEVAAYMEGVGSMPVFPPTRPGEVLGGLPERAPETGEGWDAILGDVHRLVIPHLTHWQHPGFFAYFPCNASGPGVLGEILSAGLNVNGMLWATSPAATELETRVVDWCRELFGLPEAFTGNGVIQGTASEATLIALLAARQRARRLAAGAHRANDFGDDAVEPGRPAEEFGGGEEYCVLTSAQAHSSVVKAAMVAGIARGPEDRRRVRLIRTHADGSMDLADLERELRVIAAGRQPGGTPEPWPVMVSATAGTTGTGAVDDVGGVRRVLDAVHREQTGGAEPSPVWLHVDAAWAGAAAVCPEHRDILEGAAVADSLCVNPHKWLLTNFDCDLMWVRDRAELTSALSITPAYLKNAASETGAVIDYRDWQIPLGRRFRALKLWFVLRHYGAEGLRAHIRRHVAWSAWFESRVRESGVLELIAPNRLALVCFRLRGADDAANRALLERINAVGEVFLSHTTAPGDGGFVIRFTPGATATEFAHVARAWEIVEEAAREAAAGPRG